MEINEALKSEKKKLPLKKILLGVWGLVTVAAVVGCVILFTKSKKGIDATKSLGSNSGITYQPGNGSATQEQPQLDPETQKIVDGIIARVVELAKITDTSVKPDVGRIANIEGVRPQNPEFFKDAQNGDYVVKYPAPVNAIFLYSPTQDKIIKAAKITPTDQTGTTTPSQ